ncbi:hypothetical protein CEXT_216841, partial [Caerostris extrusa]
MRGFPDYPGANVMFEMLQVIVAEDAFY